jgi:enoyl-CoA hydratase
MSAYEQCDLSLTAALRSEFNHGLKSLQAGGQEGAARFAGGEGRHGSFLNHGE